MVKKVKPVRMYMAKAEYLAPYYGIALSKAAMVQRIKDKQRLMGYPCDVTVVRVTVSESDG